MCGGMLNYALPPRKKDYKCGNYGVVETTNGPSPYGWNLSDSEPHYWMCNKCQHDEAKYPNWDDFIPTEEDL